MPEGLDETNNPDERSWCTEQLWQNIRHPYHTFLAQGETESLKVLFSYYRRFWDMNRYRARRYYQAEGQHNTEMTLSFGLMSLGIYGTDRRGKPTGYTKNRHGGAVDISPGLELLSLMLDYYDYTKDGDFFRTEIQVYARDLYRYIETRFRKRCQGKLVIEPLNSIETYRNTRNPLPVIAGLQGTVRRMLEAEDLTEPFCTYFKEYQRQIPKLCCRREEDQLYLQPAEAYSQERYNVEIPELYACFPFGLLDLFSGDRKLMERTFLKRMEQYGVNQYFRIGNDPSCPSYSGWQYQGIVAAKLGMTWIAEEIIKHNVRLKNPGTRFPAMWGPIYDGVPDTDHGANIVHLLQQMVMQVKGDRIYLLPAFPKSWDAAFRLHPDGDTTITAEYRQGLLKNVSVWPPEARERIIVKNMGKEQKNDIEGAGACRFGASGNGSGADYHAVCGNSMG